ncbi:MAG: GAF domain-containing protein, partial [Anaerolineales bacterium]|nr:GAF domain-containing protein [Anaerolineales bacterium]
MQKTDESYYKHLFQEAPIGIFQTTPGGQVLDANPAMVKMLKFPDLETLCATSIFDLYADPEVHSAEHVMPAVKAGIRQSEFQLRCFDGSLIWVRGTVQVSFNEDGEPRYFEGIIEDISERIQASQALSETRAQADAERAQRMFSETLRQVSSSISASLQLDKVLEGVLENLSTLIDYEGASILLRTNDHLAVVAYRGPHGIENIEEIRVSLQEDTLAKHIFENQTPLVIPDVQSDRRFVCSKLSAHIHSWIGVPLIARGVTFGLLCIDHNQSGIFTERHVQVVHAFAGQAAIAIENARLYETEHQRANELNALRATAADITAELELPVLLQSILRRAINLLKASGGELGLYDENQDEILITACLGMATDFTNVQMKANRGVLGHVVKNRAPLLITDYSQWQGHLPMAKRWPYKGVIAAPLIVRERILGVIALVDQSEQREFTETELELLTLFGQQAAIAIENAQLFQDTETALDRTRALYEIAQALITTTTLGALLESLVQQITKALKADRSILIMLDPEKQEVLRYVRGGSAKQVGHPISFKELWDGLTGWVMRERIPALSPKDSVDTREQNYVRKRRQETNTGSVVVVPLLYREQVLGTLTAINTPTQRDFTSRDLDLLTTIASNAAVAIKNALLFEEIQYLAETDDLTGINNRRQLFVLGNHEFIRAQRYQAPLAAMMLDIDDFKHINDEHGHAVGDDVLRGLAQICTDNIRDTDILGRYGGEEFVIVLPETDLERAVEIARRLRRQVEHTPIGTKAGALNITVSLGVAEIGPQIPDLSTLIDRA